MMFDQGIQSSRDAHYPGGVAATSAPRVLRGAYCHVVAVARLIRGLLCGSHNPRVHAHVNFCFGVALCLALLAPPSALLMLLFGSFDAVTAQLPAFLSGLPGHLLAGAFAAFAAACLSDIVMPRVPTRRFTAQ